MPGATWRLRIVLGALLCAVLSLSACSREEQSDPFRRLVADAEHVFIVHSGGGLIQQVSRPREVRGDPTTTDVSGADLTGNGVAINGELWVAHSDGVGPLRDGGLSDDRFVSIDQLIGLGEDSARFSSIVSLTNYRELLWIGIESGLSPEEKDLFGIESGSSFEERNFLVLLDTRGGRILRRIPLAPTVHDAAVSGDRLVVLAGGRLSAPATKSQIQIRRADSGALLAKNSDGLGGLDLFDRLSRGGPDLWLTISGRRLIGEVARESGNIGFFLSVPCRPEVVLAVPQGLIVACADRPSILLQRRGVGSPNELPLEGEAPTDVAGAADAVWAVGSDATLTRLQIRDLPWPDP